MEVVARHHMDRAQLLLEVLPHKVLPFLGHPHMLSGAVVHGNEIGRTLGSPTANLPVPQGVIRHHKSPFAAK